MVVLALVLFGFVSTANAAGAQAPPDRMDVRSICVATDEAPGPPKVWGVPRPPQAPCNDAPSTERFDASSFPWGTLIVSGIGAALVVGLFVWMLRQRRSVPA